MIPYGKQSINQDDIDAVVEVLRSDFLTQGPKIREFEEKLAQYCGAKFAVASAHGTDALHLAYLAAGLKAGDEVITTPNTFAATTNMLLAVGAKPVFCDIRLDTYNIDEQQIEKLITTKTRAIVPVHFAGQPADMKTIWAIAKKHNLLVIEDAAHALGASYQGTKIGGGQSDMVIMSFHPVKAITTGEGGAVLTSNQKYHERLQHYRTHGIYKDPAGKNVMIDLGYNYRITDIQAALGVSQLRRLDEFLQKRRQVVEWYREALAGLKEIILPVELPDLKSGWHLFVIRVAEQKYRDPLFEYLKAKGVGANFHYPSVYSHPYYRQNGYADLKLPNAEVYHNTAITIPCHQTLTAEEVRYISDTIKDFFSHAKA